MSYLVRQVLLIVLTFTTIFMAPGIANALPPQSNTSAVVAKVATSVTELDLTPRQRQMIQALNQGRNREIAKVLNQSEQKKLIKLIRSGNSFNQAVDKLNLKSDKRDILKALSQVYDLKMKSLISAF
jgi:Spy/CpxP family protein refolding chaperone